MRTAGKIQTKYHVGITLQTREEKELEGEGENRGEI
jgi:hypothetical protein